jgi:hypothetical protein
VAGLLLALLTYHVLSSFGRISNRTGHFELGFAEGIVYIFLATEPSVLLQEFDKWPTNTISTRQ